MHATTDKAFIDLTGRFPYKSSRGNKCVLIAHHFYGNASLGRTLQNRQAATITKAWKFIQDELTLGGAATSTWRFDNETSHELQTPMAEHNISCQFVPPYSHRANIAERVM